MPTKRGHNGRDQDIQCVDCHGAHVEYDPNDPTNTKGTNVYLIRRNVTKGGMPSSIYFVIPAVNANIVTMPVLVSVRDVTMYLKQGANTLPNMTATRPVIATSVTSTPVKLVLSQVVAANVMVCARKRDTRFWRVWPHQRREP